MTLKLCLAAISAVMFVSATDALAQPASSPGAQQSAFEAFKAAMEDNRVAWKGARTQPYRVITQSISGTSCAPVWTQVRVNGTSRVPESYTIDWNKVSGISTRQTSVVTFNNGSDGQVGVETSSPAEADGLATSMEALRAACSKPTLSSAGPPSGELTSLITQGRYTMHNTLGRTGHPDDWTLQRVIVRAEDQDRCTTTFVAGDVRSSPNVRPASSYVLSWKSVSDVWSDKSDVRWRASHMAPSETARLDVRDPTAAKRLADQFKARARMCGAVLTSGAPATVAATPRGQTESSSSGVRKNTSGPTVAEIRAASFPPRSKWSTADVGPLIKGGGRGEFQYELPDGPLAIFWRCASDQRCDRAAFLQFFNKSDKAAAERVAKNLSYVNYIYVRDANEFISIVEMNGKHAIVQDFEIKDSSRPADIHARYNLFYQTMIDAEKEFR